MSKLGIRLILRNQIVIMEALERLVLDSGSATTGVIRTDLKHREKETRYWLGQDELND